MVKIGVEGIVCEKKKLQEIILVSDIHCCYIQKKYIFPLMNYSFRLVSREYGCEGLILKRLSSKYKSGLKTDEWWKWKTDPRPLMRF
jgi:ATP-dependent DNA ligase